MPTWRFALLSTTAARTTLATTVAALLAISATPAAAQFAGTNGSNGASATPGVAGAGGASGASGDGSLSDGVGGVGAHNGIGSAGSGPEGGPSGTSGSGRGAGGGPDSGGAGATTSSDSGAYGGGGGGGGGRGAAITTDFNNTSTIVGGNGGNGGNGSSSGSWAGGGGGGGGGNGVVLVAPVLINSGTIRGGNGGSGGVGTGGNYSPTIDDGAGGAGGSGILVQTGGPAARIENSGTIEGGNGGNATSVRGQGGVGIKGRDLTIINSGTINGGGTANAIVFTGGANRLELQAGSSITGNAVVQSGTGVLALGGAANSSFNVSALQPGSQYQGFTSLEKAGTSTWTLTGATTKATPWTLSEGTLSVSADNNLGTGALTFNGGTLQVTGTGFSSTARAINLGANGGSFEIVDANHTLTVSQGISGSGRLTKTGLGTLALSGANNYSGGTTISAGTLVGDSTSLKGPIVNNGALVFKQSIDGTFADNISGSGSLTKAGTGTLTLTGINTYTGGTNVNRGTLVIAGPGALASGPVTFNGGVLRFSYTGALDRPIDVGGSGFTADTNGNNQTMQAPLSGGGTFTKTGSGLLNLTGTSTLSGQTTVEAGRLAVNGSLASSVVTTQSGATLSGSGTIGGLFAQGGATVAPGNSIGTLHVAGNIGFAAGSVYQVEVNAAGQSDRIEATGTATLSGGTVQVLAESGNYSPSTTYQILSATGGVNGTFADVNTDLAFLTPSLGYQANAVILTLVRKTDPTVPPKPDPTPTPTPTPVAFNSVAVTANQWNTANGLEALGGGNPLFGAVLGTNASGARQAFDALSGEAHASAATTAYGDAALVRNALLSRLRNASDSQPGGIALWGDGFGSWGKLGSNGNAAGLDTSTGGFIIGADASINSAYRVGIAGGFTRTTFDITGRASSGANESVFGAAYGSAQWDAIRVRLGAAYASHDIDLNRTVVFPGFRDAVSTSYGGSTMQAFGEVGYRFAWGGFQVEPFAGASILRLHTDRFQENGGAAALTGYGRTYDLATTTLGVRAEARLSDDIPLTLRGMLGWRAAYGDVAPSALQAFAGGTSAFAVSGVPVDRNALVAEAGLDWQATSNLSLGVAYTGQIGSQAQDHAVKGNLTWKF
ncbi:autotransporter outer membrane beta-barrel domain-containing protein [Microvirga alba]|uniref:Autotransporter domain-containing protein n=1 Tax=Microvirga alba TaxID=2791025 RepID=A0A931FQ33_9HYPH|nr:autotransporter domain-containing protein [Microvirga alba]MBF9233063.1 autotransporter domain-containing protein [Microvirga alba]